MMDMGYTGEDVRWPASFLTVFAGITMVSNFPYWSGKDINLRKSVPFIFVIALVMGFVLISSYPPGILFLLFLAYAASGYLLWVLRWKQRRDSRSQSAP